MLVFKLSVILLISVMVGCNTIEIQTRYSFNGGSEKYQSFNLTSESNELDMNEHNRNLLRNLVTKELEDRGYVLSDEPDFWVDLNAETFLRINPLTYSNGYSGMDSKVYTTPAGKLYIQLLNSSKDRVIWRAVASSRVERTYKNSLLIAKAVRKVFKEFPD